MHKLSILSEHKLKPLTQHLTCLLSNELKNLTDTNQPLSHDQPPTDFSAADVIIDDLDNKIRKQNEQEKNPLAPTQSSEPAL